MISKNYFESDSAVIPYRTTLKVEKLSTGAILVATESGEGYCSTIIGEPESERFLNEYRNWLEKEREAENFL